MANFLNSVYLLLVLSLLNLSSGASIPETYKQSKRGDKTFKMDFDVVKVAKNSTAGNNNGQSGGSTIPQTLMNEGNSYTGYIYIGSDKQKAKVVIDTGSSDLWVSTTSTGGYFDPSSSSTLKKTGQNFNDAYGDQSTASGYWAKDSVSLSPNEKGVTGLQFGVADQSTAGNGILGIGLVGLESTTETGQGTYQNFPALLKDQGLIDKNAYSLYLNSEDAKSGTILFGGYDKAKFDGELVSLPFTGQRNQNGDNYRLDVTLNSVAAEGDSGVSINKPVNLDSGTTITLLPNEVVEYVAEALNANDDGTVDCNQPDKHLLFNFNGVTIKVPYQDLAFPGNFGTCSLAMQGPIMGNELILGDNFLRHAYIVYDLDDKKISLAQVKYTSESDIVNF